MTLNTVYVLLCLSCSTHGEPSAVHALQEFPTREACQAGLVREAERSLSIMQQQRAASLAEPLVCVGAKEPVYELGSEGPPPSVQRYIPLDPESDAP